MVSVDVKPNVSVLFLTADNLIHFFLTMENIRKENYYCIRTVSRKSNDANYELDEMFAAQ